MAAVVTAMLPLALQLGNDFAAEPLHVLDELLAARVRQFDHGPGNTDLGQIAHCFDVSKTVVLAFA